MFQLRKHGRFWRPAKIPPQYTPSGLCVWVFLDTIFGVAPGHPFWCPLNVLRSVMVQCWLATLEKAFALMSQHLRISGSSRPLSPDPCRSIHFYLRIYCKIHVSRLMSQHHCISGSSTRSMSLDHVPIFCCERLSASMARSLHCIEP